MPLHHLLSADRIAILVEPGDRGAVLDAAARLLAGTSASSAAAIGASLRQREQLACTAIGHGVAIPHGRIAAVEEIRGAFLRLADPVDFGAHDGEPVDLVLAMVVPEHCVQEHLQQLAELAERFADPDFRLTLRAAATTTELGRCLLDGALPRRTTVA